jgi:short-subunit dehydrogenase
MSNVKLKPIEEQVIVITGASSGIGLATAMLAAKRGAKVVLAARSDEALDSCVAQIAREGGEAISVYCDVTQRSDVERVAETAITRFGRIDTWVNNAGLAIYGRLDEVSDEDSRKLFEVNFWGVVYGSLVALPFLKSNGGALINIGSEVSDATPPLLGMYSASKHAVKGFTDALRVEIENVDKRNVSITLIQPTAVDTPFPQHARSYLEVEPQLPDPKIEPQKVAEAILDAATHHRRDVTVGAMSKINTLTAKIAPSLGDKMAATYVEKQKSDEPPRDPAGALDAPRGEGRIHGEGPGSKAAKAGAKQNGAKSVDGPSSHR